MSRFSLASPISTSDILKFVPPRRRLRPDFNLSGQQAEADPLLEKAFYEFDASVRAESKTDPHCFLIGRTGSGKSAVLQRLEEIQSQHVIRIDPENLSLPYILNLGVVQQLNALDVNLDPFFIALWKHIFLVEVIKHRYHIDSPEAKRNLLQTLKERVIRDHSKVAALDYLDRFGQRFWCETDERIRDIVEIRRILWRRCRGQHPIARDPCPGSSCRGQSRKQH